MTAEQSAATTSATTVPAAAEMEPVAAESRVAAAAADAVRWEFRLTADRRRVLIPVTRTTDPELE